jgi:predicted DNA-binding transcriptional regulator AlpA
MTTAVHADSGDMLDDRAAAEYIGMSVAYLRMDRLRGTVGGRTPGPTYYRIGRAIRYRRSDLDAWLDTCRVERRARG